MAEHDQMKYKQLDYVSQVSSILSLFILTHYSRRFLSRDCVNISMGRMANFDEIRRPISIDFFVDLFVTEYFCSRLGC